MTIVFEAYTAPASRTSATLAGANGSPRGSFMQSGEVALLGRQTGAKFSATWELTGTLSGAQGSPRAAFFSADALRGVNGAPAGKFYQSSGSLVGTHGAPRGLFGFAEPALAARSGAVTGLFSAAPATNGAVLAGTTSGASWSSTSTYAETWNGSIGTHGAPRGFFAQTGEVALLGRQALPPRSSFMQAITVQNYVGMNLGLYAYVGANNPAIQALIDSFRAQDAQSAAFILAILDLFSASDTYSELLHALQALHDGLSLVDIARLLYTEHLLDHFIASGVMTGKAQITLLLADSWVAHDAPISKSQVLAAIADAMYVSVSFSTGEDTYTAWVMTPQTRAMRSYSNWPFNSFAVMNDQFLATGPQGVYKVGGATDAGALITARVRTGLMDFGTRRLKRIDRAYLGYTSTGTLCLRVCATTATGDKTEYTYSMVPQTANAAREGRIGVGRGTRSVYFSFELNNEIDGSNFELLDMTLLPIVLTGRVI